MQSQMKRVDHIEQRLDLDRPQVYALIRAGLIGPPVVVRVGRQYRVNADALEEWIEAGGASYPGGWRREKNQAGR